MRVLFLGHTGISKDVAVRNVANAYLAKQDVSAPRYVRLACLEDKLPATAAGVDVRGFLDINNEYQARRIWLDAFNSALEDFRSAPPEAHQFLSLHATYYRAGVIYSRADLEVIQSDFPPDVVVTLIDDVYDVASVIASRDSKDALRLREIATWRAVELLVGDYIAGPSQVKNFVVAVKHPVSVLERLLFDQQAKRVYCAYPISRTRAQPEQRAEINAFKDRLRAVGVTVFDPVTIDDLVLVHALGQGDSADEYATVRDDDRWELADEQLLIAGRPPTHEGSERQFRRSEIEEVTKDLGRQVETRDFRLIEDSNGLVAYRPYWGTSPSRGVSAELHFAQDRGRRVFIYSPLEDGAPSSVFDQFPNVYLSVTELLERVSAWNER